MRVNNAVCDSPGLAEGDPDYVLEEQIGFLLRRAHQRATAVFQNRIAPEPLTPPQFAALAKLLDLGEVTQNRLGRLVDMDPATMQGVIRRLAQRGWVARVPDPDHKRRLSVRLTEQGESVARRCLPSAKRVSSCTLEPLDNDERIELVRLLRKLTD